MSSAPFEPLRGTVPQCTSSLALDQPGPGGLMDPAAELAVERVRAARRADLELQAAAAQAELAELTAAPPEVEPTRRGGWMRRPTPP